MLRVNDLHSGEFFHHVLRGISLEVCKGEIVALVGPNGAGKTTLLRTITGLIPKVSGEITFNGEDITGLSTDRVVHRGLSYVPEGISLFPRMTVEQNLKLASLAAKRADAGMIDSLLSLFPFLKDKYRHPAGNLAGGQRRMLTIARGLACNPVLTLLDDPFLGLSPKMVIKLCEFLREKNDDGLTIMIVGQHVKRILRMSSRAYFLEEGRITLSGMGAEFLKNHNFREKLIGLRTKGGGL